MELQSFALKLSELKEYDQAKEERRGDGGNKEPPFVLTPQEKPKPKTKAEIRDSRIGLNMNTIT